MSWTAAVVTGPAPHTTSAAFVGAGLPVIPWAGPPTHGES